MPRRDNIHDDDRTVTCPECDGLGWVESIEVPGERVTCPRCTGRGRVRFSGLADVEPF